ncbi:hypothetical protein BH11VER1_BH11VER1_37210 [soil metagenome]
MLLDPNRGLKPTAIIRDHDVVKIKTSDSAISH